jgi:hypothetical protein
MWRTAVVTAVTVLVVPWLLATILGKGQPDTLVAFVLLLTTPILIGVGIVLGFAVYGLRIVRYNADDLASSASDANSPAGESVEEWREGDGH